MKRRTKSNLLKGLLSFSLVVGMLVGSIPVMAADNSDDIKSISSIAEEKKDEETAKELRNKIDNMLNEDTATRASYKTDYWGEVTFTNTNVGAYHTIYGHKARMAIAFKPVDGNTALSAALSTGFWGWTLHYSPNHVDSDGYYMYVGPWEDIKYMGAYRMTYKIFTTGNGGALDGRRASFHVWVDYQ